MTKDNPQPRAADGAEAIAGELLAPTALVHDFNAVAKFVEKYKTPVMLPLEHDKPVALLVPEGLKVVDAKPISDKFRPEQPPERRKGTAELSSLESFIQHVQRFRSDNTALFADDKRDAPSLTAVFDYHPQGPESTKAGFRTHRANYKFPLSDEWQAWHAHDGEPMSQAEFYEFLEDRILDIAPKLDLANMPDPDEPTKRFIDMIRALGSDFAGPADIMQLAKGIKIRVNDVIKEERNISSGEVSLMYESKHADAEGNALKVPGLFLLQIPVFNLGPVYQLAVRLRYRVVGGKVMWQYVIYRADWAFDDAFNEACELVVNETSVPLFRGKPE